VVKIFEVCEDNGRHFIALEFLPENLARVIECGGTMRIDRAVTFGVQIAEGLVAAHALSWRNFLVGGSEATIDAL
jgi:hypothetical protein